MNDSGGPNSGQQPGGAGVRTQSPTAAQGAGTTTTTTTTTTNWNLDWVKIDIPYFMTLPGILKIVQWVLGILCMILGSPALVGGGHFFLFVVVMAFIITFLWICIYFFSIREGLQLAIPWVLAEFFYTAITTIFYFIAMIVQFSTGYYTRYIIAGLFGLFNTLAYAGGAYFLFRDYKHNANTNAQTNVP